MANNKSMPYNLEAEQSILGCILLDQEVQGEIISMLKPHDFLVESHKLIFEAIVEVYGLNKPVDLVTLADVMQKKATLEKAGGISYLTDLTDLIPSSANYSQYLDIVKRDGILRRLISGSSKIIENASNSIDSKQSLSFAEQTIFDISKETNKHGLENINQYFQPVIDRFEKLEKDKNYFVGLKTGFPKLDSMTNGLHRGNLVILAARPSIGKTTLAMNIVENIAMKSDAVCAVFALEMTKEELAQRMLCSFGNVNMDNALKGRLSSTDPESYSRLWEAQKALDKASIFVDESSEVTPQDILSKCRRLKLKYGLDLIVVDHIQLMQAQKKNVESRQQEVTEISRGLKMIAKELDVTVIALSQLSRQVTSRKGGKPVLSDLRESGAIEQDADLVLFIHRPDKDADVDESKNAKPNFTELIIAKNRNGTCGEVELLFKGENVKFLPAPQENIPEPPPDKQYDAKREAANASVVDDDSVDSNDNQEKTISHEKDPVFD